MVKSDLSNGETDAETLETTATLLVDHARFEERHLFPMVERLVPEDELRDLATAGRRDV